jgi:hypothetical protein
MLKNKNRINILNKPAVTFFGVEITLTQQITQ